MNIYIGNIPHQATDENLREVFEPFGRVLSVCIIKDKYSGQSRGFGFVEMPEKSQGAAAIQAVNGRDLMGQPLKVTEARPKTDRPATARRTGFGAKRRY